MPKPIQTEAFPRAHFSLMHAEVFLKYGACAQDATGLPHPMPASGSIPLKARLCPLHIRFTRSKAVLTYQ